MIAWLRRLWAARRTTVAEHRPSKLDLLTGDRAAWDAIRTAPCEPTKAPDHVARAKANRTNHYRALGEDPDADWGPFDATTIGWAADRHPGDAA